MDQMLNDRIDKMGIVPFPEALRGKVRNGTIHECKIIFLGNGGSGKSSLIERILYDKVTGPYKNPTTGIDTFWGLTTARRISDPDKAVCCLRFMDFGGQEIQASIHRCFMTAHTIYVLVCDLNKAQNSQSSNTALDQISRWLYEVHLFAPKSPVLVVLNKSDLVEKEEIPQTPVAHRKASAINGAVHDVLVTSAVKESRDEAVGRLIEAIRIEIRGCCNAIEKQERWHKNWLVVRQELEAQDSNYISHAEFQTVCQQHGILQFQQKKLLAWLQNQGAFYACSGTERGNCRLQIAGEFPTLDLPVLLNPGWLAKRIYHVVSYSKSELPNQSDAVGKELLHHEDVMRILHFLNQLSPEELTSVTAQELRQRMDMGYSVNITEKDQWEKDCLLSVTRRLYLSFQWGPHEDVFPSRMTEIADIHDIQIDSHLHQRWIVGSISSSDEIYTPPLHVSILHQLMCSKADILTRPDKNYVNYAQFAKGEYRIDVVLNKSQLELRLWGEEGEEGKRLFKEFRDLVRDYLKENHIPAAEYAFDGNTPYAVEYLKANARVVLNTEENLTGRDIMRKYSLSMGFPSLSRKKPLPQPISGLNKATQFLALAAVIMVAVIIIISLGKHFFGVPVSSTNGTTDSVPTIIVTEPENADSSVSPTNQESTHTEAVEESAEDAEHRANARWTDTKRVLLIICVSIGIILVVTLFSVLLYLRIKRRDEDHTALMGALTDIRDLIGSSQK